MKNNKLKKITKEKNFNYRQLAEKINVDPSYISKIANGKIGKNNIARKYLAKLLDVDVKELI